MGRNLLAEESLFYRRTGGDDYPIYKWERAKDRSLLVRWVEPSLLVPKDRPWESELPYYSSVSQSLSTESVPPVTTVTVPVVTDRRRHGRTTGIVP